MKVLVSRFSSIGDVALSIPILHAINQYHPDLEILMLSRPQFGSLFEPLNMEFISADLRGRHKGIAGLRKLQKEISRIHQPELYVDLHDVLRTKILRKFFSLAGTRTSYINKGRKEKQELTRRHHKNFKQLPHTLERYQEAFAQVGISVPLHLDHLELPGYRSKLAEEVFGKLNPSGSIIGFAPFAAHQAKTWPMEFSERLLDDLNDDQIDVLLFGGPEDRGKMEALAMGRDWVHVIPEHLSFGDEIALMSHLDAMLSMDSANMHLASLAQIPVLSIWGGTHPYAGFGPVGQDAQNIIGIGTDQLDCRPCSVYGNKACFRGDYACLNLISPTSVKERILKIVQVQ